ncbi:beta-galactosidase BglB [Cohnella fermenti]|uniref:Glycoside hydrolase family 105 protein n=1 Tax=Cohnella fermenti TaxID=2565925 RepID=A0A4S4BX98_9BACL|nr:glycoside hydrolase family 88 protein [Cohnella fermenti]THF77737.1 glycoside hydrolase family 105 protein [Cohnella fermenti]
MDKAAISALIDKVASKMQNLGNETGLVEECPISIISMDTWEWAQGVGLYGLYNYYQETGEAGILDFLVEWFERNIRNGLPEKNVNTLCPMLTLSLVAEETGREDLLALCQEWAQWIMEEMPRTEANGLQHIVTGNANSGQLWDDTLFMTVLFLARAGKLFNRKDYTAESVRQFLVHIKYLADRKTGLWYHGWTFEGRHHFAEALWARGNCWYTAGVVDYLDIVDDLDPGVKLYLLDTLRSQVAALERLQHPGGMWHTLLDDPSSYVETSATAGFAYGILKAVRLGYLDPRCLPMGRKAAEAVISQISEDGTVQNVSYGTGMGATLEEYRQIKLCPMTYGQALPILMLTEVMKLS